MRPGRRQLATIRQAMRRTCGISASELITKDHETAHPPTLLLTCPVCHCEAHQPIAELQQGRAKCTSSRLAIKLTPDFVAIVQALG